MTTPMLETLAVSKSFALRGDGRHKGHSGFLKAVDQVSLTLGASETLGIAGESGCGKSTLAKLITGLLAPDSGGIMFQGAELTRLTPDMRRLFRRSVQMIFQDPFSSLNPRLRIGDAIAEPLLIHGLAPAADCRARAESLMQQVGLAAELYDRFPHEFSGGQRQRIGIARALAANPSVLVADEPVSSLDISIQAQIINLLLELKREQGLTMAVISHDLAVLRHISDHIAVMYLGAVVELAPTQALFERCRHPYTEALLAAIPRIHQAGQLPRIRLQHEPPARSNLPSGCRFHPRCPHAREICRQQAPGLSEQVPGHAAACHLSSELYSL
ncbi:MAG: oligopeptide/dipeptide ABC transporter ATP-binding protein [Trichlorobacter sp.]|jgi:peptide/nickel transport system ATP-binding protein